MAIKLMIAMQISLLTIYVNIRMKNNNNKIYDMTPLNSNHKASGH